MNASLSEFFAAFAATNQWTALMPEIALGVLALWLLVLEMFLPAKNQKVIPKISILGQLCILIIVYIEARAGYFNDSTALFSGMIEQSGTTHWMRGFFLVSSILVSFLGTVYFQKQSLARTEFYHLVLIVAAALMLLVQSAHFLMLFVALETVTVCFYVLVAYCRTSESSLEGGLKYLILGALSSAILLFGIVLLYGAAGNPGLTGATTDGFSFSELKEFVLLNTQNSLVLTGSALVLAGLAFKIGAVPFQIWVPDVYQGAPTPVTAYLAVASKAAGFIVLINVLNGPFAALSDFLLPLLSVVAALTILLGNIAAVSQRNVKRLMGLSGVAHAGYLLLGVIAAWTLPVDHWAESAVLFYLVTYLVGSFAVFSVMSFVSGMEDEAQTLGDYSNLSRERPFLAMVLALGLGSLAGIPPLAGFIGKLFLFIAAFQAKLYGLLAIAIVGVVISIYYYFGWIREAFFEPRMKSGVPPEQRVHANGLDRLVMAAVAAAVVLIGLYPGLLGIMR